MTRQEQRAVALKCATELAVAMTAAKVGDLWTAEDVVSTADLFARWIAGRVNLRDNDPGPDPTDKDELPF